MVSYGRQYAAEMPQAIEITASAVFLASNIKQVTRELEGRLVNEYAYDLVKYDKNEYIAKLAQDNATLKQQVIDTQMALCDIYESLEGGDL